VSRRSNDEIIRDIRALVRSEDWQKVIPEREVPEEGGPRELPPVLARALKESLRSPAEPRSSWLKKLWLLGAFAACAGITLFAMSYRDGLSYRGGDAPVTQMVVFCDGLQKRSPLTCAVGRPLKVSMAKPDELDHGTIFFVDSKHELAGSLAPQEGIGVEYDNLTMSPGQAWFGAFWSSRSFTEAELRSALNGLIANPSNLGHATSLPGLEGRLFWAEIVSVP
jgi:hypothetical protein